MSLEAKLATLDRKLDTILEKLTSLELALAVIAPHQDDILEQPDAIDRAWQMHEVLVDRMNGVYGRFTASEIARRCGFKTDKGTLAELGRVLDRMGIERARTNKARVFIFIKREEECQGQSPY